MYSLSWGFFRSQKKKEKAETEVKVDFIVEKGKEVVIIDSKDNEATGIANKAYESSQI